MKIQLYLYNAFKREEKCSLRWYVRYNGHHSPAISDLAGVYPLQGWGQRQRPSHWPRLAHPWNPLVFVTGLILVRLVSTHQIARKDSCWRSSRGTNGAGRGRIVCAVALQKRDVDGACMHLTELCSQLPAFTLICFWEGFTGLLGRVAPDFDLMTHPPFLTSSFT